MNTKLKHRLAGIFAGILMCLAIFSGAFAQKINPGFIDGKVYFKLKDNVAPIPSNGNIVDINDFYFFKSKAAVYNIAKVAKPFYTASDDKLQRTYSVEISNYSLVDDLIKELMRTGQIEYAEKAPLYKIVYHPNDADYGSSAANRWHLDKINAEGAWDICKGDMNIKVAVIDNGIYVAHPELVNQVVAQIDLAENDNDPTPDSTSAEWSHGTHTSGLVTATTDNSVGVASIGYNLGLIAIKVGRKSDGALVAGFEGITWAADHGARVISMSWGGTQYAQTLQNIVDYAYNKGIVLVASAGNNGDGSTDPTTTNSLIYPAALNHVISVGATNGNDVMTSFSEYGTWIDVCAPGGYQNGETYIPFLNIYLPSGSSVYSLAYGTGTSGYTTMAGTSMSAPICAGLCGLMLAKDPTLTPDRVEQYLKATCVNINSLQDATHNGMTGAGRINAQAAMQMVVDSVKPLVANFSASSTIVGINGYVNFTDHSIGGPVTWQWTFNGGNPSTANIQNPSHIVYNTPGTYTVSLTVTDTAGHTSTETKTNFVSVNPPASSEWLPQATAFTSMYRGIQDISIIDHNTAWATAYDGSGSGATITDFTRTTDGGNTWIPGTISGYSGWGIGNISAVSCTKAWVSLYNASGGGKILMTNNGGISWIQQSPGTAFVAPTGFANVIHMFDDSTGFAMGDPNSNGSAGNYFEIYTTSDGGNTWVKVPDTNIPVKLAAGTSGSPAAEMGWTGIYDTAGDTIWFGTNRGRIFRSVDKGLHWTAVTTGSADCNKITMFNSLDGYMFYRVLDATNGGVSTYELRHTTDGGATWNLVTTSGPIYKSDLAVISDVPGMLVSTGGYGVAGSNGSSYSFDQGATWHRIDTVQYTSCFFKEYSTGWAGGYNLNETTEGIYKWKGLMRFTYAPQCPFCAGDSVHIALTVTGPLKSGNIFTAQLSDVNGFFANATNIGTLTSDTSGTIQCVIPASTLSGNGYKIRIVSSNPVLVSLEVADNISIKALAAANAGPDASVCNSSNYQLNGTAINANSVAWTTLGTGTFDDNTSLNALYTPSNADITNGSVDLVLAATSTCGSASDSVHIIFSTSAIADAGLDVNICSGTSVMLIANGGNTFDWAADPSLSAVNISNPVASPSVTTTYTVTVSGTCGSASDEVVITVNPVPTAVASATGVTTVCQGDNVTLIATVDSTCTYQWLKNGNVITGAIYSSYDVGSTGNYSVILTNGSNCSDTSSIIAVVVNPIPYAYISPSGTIESCIGDTILLQAPTGAGLTYQWKKDGVDITGEIYSSLVVTTDGNYLVYIADSNQCSANSNMANIIFNPTPAKPTITQVANPIRLRSSSNFGNQWYLNGVAISGSTSQMITPTQSGQYTVQVTNTYNCVSDMSDPFDYIVGVGDIAYPGYLNIYPNPAGSVLNIDISNSGNNVNITMTNVLGDIVYNTQSSTGSGINHITADVSGFAEGVYFIKLSVEDKVYLQRIVVKH